MHNTPSEKEFANLDVLRSVAVGSVFFAHLFDFLAGRGSEITWHFGQLGVLIFFVHTSLVLMQSMERLTAGGYPLFSTFYVRRWFRIYPLSIFCVLVAYRCHLAPALVVVTRHWNVHELLANLSLTQNVFYLDSMVGGLWTLPLEVQMYVVLPALFLFFRNRRLAWFFALWAAAIPLALIQPKLSERLNVLGYAPCFLAGLIAWRLLSLTKPKLAAGLWPVGLAVVSLVWLSASRQYNMLYRWMFCLLLGCVIPWFHQLEWKGVTLPAKLIARYSYGIYLSHMAIMMVCFRMLAWPNRIGVWAFFIALVIVIPVLLYHGLEYPLIILGRTLTRRYSRPGRPG